MKRLLFVVFLAVVTQLPVAAASAAAFVSTGDAGWYWQNQLPQGNGGNGVFFADAKHGWATGYWGTILATTDGGLTWVAQQSGTVSTLVGITFVDTRKGWAVGYDGAILKTTNGGATWQCKYAGETPSTQYRLFSVSFADAKHGWIAGAYDSGGWWYGLILATNDGGVTWKTRSKTTYDGGLLGISFADLSHGWAVGYDGLLIATSDGGASWKRQPSGTSEDLSDVSFESVKHGCVVTRAGSVRVTWNGGASWKRQASGKGTLYDVCLPNATKGWACGAGGVVLVTNDGGLHWTAQQSHMTDGLNAVHFSDGLHGCAIGDAGCPVTTSNGGRTWIPRGSNLTYHDLRGVCFVDELHGWVVGGDYPDKVIAATSDGGASWSIQLQEATDYLEDVSFADALHGCAVGNYYGPQILTTTDGGATWVRRTPVDTENGYFGVSFSDADHGWAVGRRGVIDATSDGGASWVRQRAAGSEDLLDVTFSDATHGWAVGQWGTIIATTDGGAHWVPQTSGTGGVLYDITFSDATHGWAVGQGGTILATTDGGAHWVPQTSGTSAAWLSGVSFSDALNGRVVGSGGTILATSNGGALWLPQQAGTGWDLWGVAHPAASHVWAIGTGGVIMASATGGFAPPRIAVTGAANNAWYNRALNIGLAATASPPATSITTLEYTLDAGSTQSVSGPTATVAVPADAATHADDGLHTLAYSATDDNGTSSLETTLGFGIDTRKPTTSAPNASAARRGTTATLKYTVADAAPSGPKAKTVTIRIYRSGVLKKTLRYTGKAVNTLQSAKFTVPGTWKIGTYVFKVYATDNAGNAQATIGSNKLVVK